MSTMPTKATPSSVVLLAKEPAERTEFLDGLSSRAAATMARRWLTSKHAPTRGADAIAAVKALLADPAAVKKMVETLKPRDRGPLEIVARYGGSVSSAVFEAELLARGFTHAGGAVRYASSDAWQHLADGGLLRPVRHPSDGSYGPVLGRACPGPVMAAVKKAAALPWQLRPIAGAVEAAHGRAHDAIALETLAVARACEALPAIAVKVDGALAAATRKRLEKALPALVDAPDELAVPDRIDLAWELLRDLGAVGETGSIVTVDAGPLLALVGRTPAELGRAFARAWLAARHWQDGVGSVPEQEQRDAIVRYGFDLMRTLRELLAWALGRLALHPPTWLDLEEFVVDLHQFAVATHGGYGTYGPAPRLPLRFAAEEGSEDRRSEGWLRARWIASQGRPIGNMLLVTLSHFGLVERGVQQEGPTPGRWAFRLTQIGREVFGAPEVKPSAHASASVEAARPLVVQGSFEVLLHHADADLATRASLARIATLVTAGERVSRYRLEPASVRGAVEAGMAGPAIVEFLTTRSRTPLPRAVAVALDEWTADRDVATLVGPGFLIVDEEGARFVSEGDWKRHVAQHPARASVREGLAALDERGHATGARLHPLTTARLSRLGTPTSSGFAITRDSVQAARANGLTPAQIEAWLEASVRLVPMLFRTQLKHWLTGAVTRGRTERWTVLRVDDATLEHALSLSPRFSEIGVSRIAPGYLRFDETRLSEITRELAEVGVVIDAPDEEAPKPKPRRTRKQEP